MSLPATSVAEVRPDGDNGNGGLFDPSAGTVDYTYPTPLVINYTDLACPTATTLTSATRPFVANDVGNTGQMPTNTGGWTGGFFNIRSVSGGTATVVWSGTSPTAGSTGGAAVLGGAWATYDFAILNTITKNVIYLKKATYAQGATMASAGGSNQFALIGYDAVRGDGGQPTLLCTAASVILISRGDGVFAKCANIIFDGGGFTGTQAIHFGNNQQTNHVYNCTFQNFTSAALSTAGGSVADCFFNNCAQCVSGGYSISNCVFNNCTYTTSNQGLISNPIDVVGCIFANCSVWAYILYPGNNGFGGRLIANNTLHGTAISSGILENNSFQSDFTSCSNIKNNIIVGCATGIQANIGIPYGLLVENNAFYLCTEETLISAGPEEFVVNSIALTANPFVNPTATIGSVADAFAAFALNNDAGGGALCRGAGGIPYQDVGAVQHQMPALGLSVALNGSSQPVLTWDADPRSTTYNVLRATAAAGPYTVLASGLTGTTYTDTSAPTGTVYYNVQGVP